MSTAGRSPDEAGDAARRPRASDWIWRPWYARIWWSTATLYWTGMIGSYWLAPLRDFYASAWAGWLNPVFFPATIIIVLGSGFIKARVGQMAEAGGGMLERESPKSVGGWSDPSSDALDPRSGVLWIGTPDNQARLFDPNLP